MALGGGMSCVKYLLFGFNLLFAITGLILLIAGVKSLISANPYVDLTDEQIYKSAPVVFIIVSIIVFIVAFFGCCGAVKENHCMIVTYSVFLLIIILAELGVGIAGYIKRNDLDATITASLESSIKQYNTNEDIEKAFDVVQTDFKCCGIHNYTDWATNGLAIPNSCCAGRLVTGGVAETCGAGSPTLHQVGCLDKLVQLFKDNLSWIGGVGLVIGIVQLLGVTFACLLARSIRSQYETV